MEVEDCFEIILVVESGVRELQWSQLISLGTEEGILITFGPNIMLTGNYEILPMAICNKGSLVKTLD